MRSEGERRVFSRGVAGNRYALVFPMPPTASTPKGEGGSGIVAEITSDEYSDNPRKCMDNLGIMVCFHSRYELGDKNELRSGDFDGWDAVEEYLTKEKGAVVVLPLYLYDHSGLRLKVGNFHGLLPQGHAEFDSGRVGFIYATRTAILKEYGGKRVTAEMRKKAEEVLRNEVSAYDQYLSGDVWTVCVMGDSGKVLDSCGGFYGYEYARKAAKEMVDNVLTEKMKDAEKEDATKWGE